MRRYSIALIFLHRCLVGQLAMKLLTACCLVLLSARAEAQDQSSGAGRDTVTSMGPGVSQTLTGAMMGVIGTAAGFFGGAVLSDNNIYVALVGAVVGEVSGVTAGVRMFTKDSHTPVSLDVLLVSGVGVAGSFLVSGMPHGKPAWMGSIGIVLAQAAAAGSLERSRGCCTQNAYSHKAISLKVLPSPGGLALVANMVR
jgi:hypothetical protein